MKESDSSKQPDETRWLGYQTRPTPIPGERENAADTEDAEPETSLLDQFRNGQLGEVLRQVAEEGGYEKHRIGKDKFCLVWPEEKSTPPSDESVFQPFQPFEQRGHQLAPHPRFLTLYETGGQYRDTYANLMNHFTGGGDHERIEGQNLSNLISFRDACETNMRRYGKRLREPMGVVLSIIRVWYYEATDALIEKDPLEKHELTLSASKWWFEFSRGQSRGKHYPSMLYGYTKGMQGLSEEFVAAQKDGVVRGVQFRNAILKDAAMLFPRWQGAEQLLERSLRGLPVMGLEDALAIRAEEKQAEKQERLLDFLTEKQLGDAAWKMEAHEEYWRRKDDGETASSIKEDLSEKHNKSMSTIEKTVYPRELGG